MILRWPDNPRPISKVFLQCLEQREPDRWIAQPKLDGWRRVAYHMLDGSWQFYAKAKGGEEARRQLPDELEQEFRRMAWPNGIALDMEWVGTRAEAGQHCLHIFDVLYDGGEWVGGRPFRERCDILRRLWARSVCGRAEPELVRIVPIVFGGFTSFFEAQKTNDASEGLVLRGAESTILGSRSSFDTNPLMLKVKHRG